MPYGPLDFTDPELAPSLYHGVLCCLHTTEPYMPDRVSRQFGRVQSIPSPPIITVRAWRKRKVKRYTVDYDPAEWVWGGKRFSLEELGEETVYPYQCSDDYHEWFASISHRFVTSRATSAVDVSLLLLFKICTYLNSPYYSCNTFFIRFVGCQTLLSYHANILGNAPTGAGG